MLNKKLIVVIMFTLAFFLLIANVVISNLSDKEEDKPENIPILQKQIDSVFMNILEEYELDTLYKKKTLKKFNKADSVRFIYHIKLPADLPSSFILTEIFSKFDLPGVKVTATETKLNYETRLEIFTNKDRRLVATFSTDLKILREKGNISFFISKSASLDEIQFKELLMYPEFMGIEILPTKESGDLKKVILNNRKEIGVIISDEISDIDYKVHSKYSKNRLLMAVRLLIGAFPDQNYFLIDKDSEIYNSTSYAYLEQEFNKRGYRIIPTYKFDDIEGESSELIIHKFNTISKKTLTGENAIFSITFENFKMLQESIIKFKKKGVRIVAPSIIINESL